MIAFLTGKLLEVGLRDMVIDVGGVGYLVSASGRTLSKIGGVGEVVQLWIHTNVREDQISLFGFIDRAEKECFNLLCTVQGVGAKAALALLSVIEAEELPMIIAAQDTAMLTRADGVGPKLATRIATELKDKVAKLDHMGIGTVVKGALKKGARQESADDISNMGVSQDAVSALINLGYGRSEAFGAVSFVLKEQGTESDVETLIQYGLKKLASG